jgi:hypothetical protein
MISRGDLQTDQPSPALDYQCNTLLITATLIAVVGKMLVYGRYRLNSGAAVIDGFMFLAWSPILGLDTLLPSRADPAGI